MSDPVTNVEIEDVLSSIRRLVSEGDQARTRDSAPVEAEASEPLQLTGADSEPEASETPGKLVLTPAFMVSDGTEQPAANANEATAEATTAEILWTEEEEIAEETDVLVTDEDDSETDGWADVADTAQESAPAPDASSDRRSALEATIAELEASVGGDEFEPDGSEDAGLVDTMIWPGTRRRTAAADDAEVIADPDADDLQAAAPNPAFETAEEDHDASLDDADSFPDDEELDAFLGNASDLDEEALRDLVTDIVRQELQGPMGERITRNVRKLVRREIYRILSSQEFD